MSKAWWSLWFLTAVVLWVYSYGFVDLNLTLSSHPLIMNFVGTLQHLVYFDRNLSLKVFIALVVTLSVCYVGILHLSVQQKLAVFPWKLVSGVAIIFSLAYPMLSSDVFKYLFSAKMIVLYHANPYTVTPNFFADDTWIRFMRWVHTTTPYGPIFTLATIPYYLLGMGKFVPVLYLFKLDQVAWYLLTIWLVGKITEEKGWKSTKVVMAQLFVALNPLILLEWLVNAHNDAPMIVLMLLSLYLTITQKRVWSIVSLALSIGIKYVTLIFAPILIFPQVLRTHFTQTMYYLLAVLTAAPLLYHYSYQYQPWYVTWIIPVTALIPHKVTRTVVALYSFSVFSRYLYFVGTGSWVGTPFQHALMTFLLPIGGGVWLLRKPAARES